MPNSVVVIVTVIFVRHIIANENSTFQGFNMPCKENSTRCLKGTFQAVFPEFVRGIPSLDIVSLDPFRVDKVSLDMPGGLAIDFKEGQTKGFRNCIINSASANENVINLVLHCNLTIKGKYRAHGKMLMFPIDGEGDAVIVCKNIRFDCSFKLDTTVRSGKKYLVLIEHNIRHSYQNRIYYKITNLFKGNPEISDLVLEFMNRNWLAVAEEFGDPIVNFGTKSVVNNIEKLIQTVPIKQLFRWS